MESVSYKKHSLRNNSKQPKAYILGGHGYERQNYDNYENYDNETFIVPPGCIIVVKTYCGSSTKAYSFLERGLCSLTPTILKDPITHYDKLERILGSLAIYRAGDVCPQFHYSLLACFQMNDQYWEGCSSFGSGVKDVDKIYADKDFLQCIRNMDPHRKSIQNKHEFSKISSYDEFDHESVYDSIYPYFSKLYQHSVFPTPEDIEIILDNGIDEGNNRIDLMMEYIGDEVSTTQEKLCNLFPGVYYHVICRSTPAGTNLFQSSANEEYKIPSHITYQSSKPYIQNLLKKHISEAEAHRKPYIRNMYAKRYEASVAMPSDDAISSVKKGPSRSTLRRRQQRQRQKQRKNRTIKHNKNNK